MMTNSTLPFRSFVRSLVLAVSPTKKLTFQRLVHLLPGCKGYPDIVVTTGIHSMVMAHRISVVGMWLGRSLGGQRLS